MESGHDSAQSHKSEFTNLGDKLYSQPLSSGDAVYLVYFSQEGRFSRLFQLSQVRRESLEVPQQPPPLQ